MSINEVRYLPECGSTNAYVKEHFEEFARWVRCIPRTRPQAGAVWAVVGEWAEARPRLAAIAGQLTPAAAGTSRST